MDTGAKLLDGLSTGSSPCRQARDMRRELEEWQRQRREAIPPGPGPGPARGKENVANQPNQPNRRNESKMMTPRAIRVNQDFQGGTLEEGGSFRPRSPPPAVGGGTGRVNPRERRVGKALAMPQSFQCPKQSELRLSLELTQLPSTEPPAPPNSPQNARAVLGCHGGRLFHLLPHAFVAALHAAFPEEEKQLRLEEEELHQEHLQLLERLGQLQAEALSQDEEVVRERFTQVTLELQELSHRQRSQEQRAWRHRVRRHSTVWTTRTALEMEDHLSRAHDIFNFWFFEMRDRVNSALRHFQALESSLRRIPEDHAIDLPVVSSMPSVKPTQVDRGSRGEKFV